MATNSRSCIQNIYNWIWIWKNSLFNPINQQTDIDKIYLYAKDPYKAKYQYLIKNWESRRLKHLNDFKAFIDYFNDMDDIYKKYWRIKSKEKM